jgi:DNA-directed RNA polymerase subunit RPC12/RpoP
MENLIFRCTQTGSTVQLWLPEEPLAGDDSYEAVNCPACGHMHFVNRTTGKTLSEKE